MLNKNITFCFMIVAVNLILINCSANSSNNANMEVDKTRDIEKYIKSENNRITSEVTAMTYEIEPLTYVNYQSILNNQEEFSTIIIDVEKTLENPFIRYESYFSCKQLAGSHVFNECDEFEGVLVFLKEPYGPDSDCYHEVMLDSQILDDLFACLEENNEYFFNNDEFEGLDIPFVVERHYVDAKKFNFRLYVHEPFPFSSGNFRIKLIDKHVDELEPDSPLYELFQIWESQLLAELQENLIECY